MILLGYTSAGLFADKKNGRLGNIIGKNSNLVAAMNGVSFFFFCH